MVENILSPQFNDSFYNGIDSDTPTYNYFAVLEKVMKGEDKYLVLPLGGVFDTSNVVFCPKEQRYHKSGYYFPSTVKAKLPVVYFEVMPEQLLFHTFYSNKGMVKKELVKSELERHGWILKKNDEWIRVGQKVKDEVMEKYVTYGRVEYFDMSDFETKTKDDLVTFYDIETKDDLKKRIKGGNPWIDNIIKNKIESGRTNYSILKKAKLLERKSLSKA
uniref:NOT2_3_5 domain-containing protein n=1 Tax=Rhabditophanes sp. KR3021 TaxID=114890 RepID=A0AC35TJ44_9BILA